MTVTATYSPLYTTGDGGTVNFTCSWPVFAATDIKVDLYSTSLGSLLSPAPVLNGGATYDYTVTLGTQDTNTLEYASATVILNNAPPSTYRVIRRRQVAATQPATFQNNTAFDAPSVETFGDRLAMSLQQTNSDASLFSLRIPFTDGAAASVTFPSAELRANTVAAFGSLGQVTVIPNADSSAAQASVFAAAASISAGSANLSAISAAASASVAQGGVVKVTTNDTTPATLATKLLAGSGASLTVGSPGGNETLTITLNAFANPTQMLFVMASPPTGWTQVTTTDNAALRLVSGTGAGTGGTANFTSAFASRTPAGTITVDNTTLTAANLPTTAVQGTGSQANANFGICGAGGGTFTAGTPNTSLGSGTGHNHTASFTGTAMDFAVKYVDIIRATKN